jgi:hypothetical protein
LTIGLNIADHLVRHRRALNFPGIHPNDVVAYRPRVHEGLLIDNRNTAPLTLVDVRHVRDFIHGHVVVYVRDLDVRHASISDVDVLHITRAGAVPGNVNFTRSKWEPSHANSDTDMESTPADESDRAGE